MVDKTIGPEQEEVLETLLREQDEEEIEDEKYSAYDNAYDMLIAMNNDEEIYVGNSTEGDILAGRIVAICNERNCYSEDFMRETILRLAHPVKKQKSAATPPPTRTPTPTAPPTVIDLESDNSQSSESYSPIWRRLSKMSELIPKESSNLSFSDMSDDSMDFMSEDTRDAMSELEDVSLESKPDPLVDREERWKGLSPSQRKALELILVEKKNTLVTGPAGTGKSHLLKVLVEELARMGKKKVTAVTGTTGVAAMNILGATIHSLTGIRLGQEPAATLVNRIIAKEFDSRWKSMEYWIIDEVSMMSAELLEKLDEIARTLRERTALFGGIQMIFFGDFFQLPPVRDANQRKEDEKRKAEGKGDPMTFCFESKIWQKLVQDVVQMESSFRQKDESLFEILNRLREGKVEQADINILRTRVSPAPLPVVNGVESTKLFSRNANVDEHNEKEINKIKEEPRIFQAETKFILHGNKRKRARGGVKNKDQAIASRIKDHPPAPFNLKLKKGAQVMLTCNLDVDKGLVNGSRGVIVGFDTKTSPAVPIVLFANGISRNIGPRKWDYDDNHEGWTLTFTQIPLKLAWAISIHKSQGLTIDRLEVDLGNSIFEDGQAYVALSRCRNLEGLRITKFEPHRIKASQKVKRFYECAKRKIPYTPPGDEKKQAPQKRDELKKSSDGINIKSYSWDPKRYMTREEPKANSSFIQKVISL